MQLIALAFYTFAGGTDERKLQLPLSAATASA